MNLDTENRCVMISQTLREARKTEEVLEKEIRDCDRPAFHLSPRTGWLNDPNGFCYYNGRYHLFYQYNPYSSRWDSMHWGHAVSEDLLHWTYLPAALAPDEAYDYHGCFSGSAMPLPDGRLLLMYTGVRNEIGYRGRLTAVQTQNMAIGDGIDFVKYEGNPVLGGESLPEGASREDFRDPKMLRLPDGSYLALIGNRPADGSGQILKYASRDGFHWSYAGRLVENRCRYGRMWECPDMFFLDGKAVLLTSPQDMLPEGFEYHNGNGTLCLIGSADEYLSEFHEENDQSIDYGIDFYAPQTVSSPDGRRIMIGWLQNWDAVAIREPDEPWAGQMSIPRELSIRDGRLWQWPIREIEAMRSDEVCYDNIPIAEKTDLPGIRGRMLDMELTIRPEAEDKPFQKFVIWFAEDEEFHTGISYRPLEHTLKVDRKFSGSRRAIVHQRRAKVREIDGALRLRIILDRFSIEVFVNGGEQVMSALLYTPVSADRISFRCDGGTALVDIRKWSL